VDKKGDRKYMKKRMEIGKHVERKVDRKNKWKWSATEKIVERVRKHTWKGKETKHVDGKERINGRKYKETGKTRGRKGDRRKT
jgi:hypothetical protein